MIDEEEALREGFPHLHTLVQALDALEARTTTQSGGIDLSALMEAMKAHEQRGGRVPWR